MKTTQHQTHQAGHVLAGTTVLLALSAIVVVGTLDLALSSNQTISSSSNRSVEYYKNEQSLGLGVGWLREHSTSLAQPFSRSMFYQTFDRTGPSVGSNDASLFAVPTKIKRQGSQASIILTNSSTLGEAFYPESVDTITGLSFSPLTLFPQANLGTKRVRVTLVDAVPVDPTKDFGDPDLGNPPPQTDFQPVYRIDAMDSLTQGGHIYGYALGKLQYDYGVGFYGRDYLEMRQPCDSYISNNGPYSTTSRRANCATGSNSTIAIHAGTTLYGSARSNGTISSESPYGGQVCSDYPASGATCATGPTCQGSSCQVPGLPSFSSWGTYCSSNQGTATPASGSILTVSSNEASQKCWAQVRVGNNRIVTLTSTTYPYFIDTLDISNTGRLNFAPSPATGTITLYVRKIVGDRLNGNQLFNINNKPYQLRLNYLGSDPLVLNGTAAMSSFIVAPYAPVHVQGNFTFSGGIKATALTFTGSGNVRYDESGDITTLKDVTYTLRNTTQRYR